MAGLEGQRIPGPESLGTRALSNSIQHYVGNTASITLNRPAGTHVLVVQAEQGNIRAMLGTHLKADFPAAAHPTAAVTDGSGSWLLETGKTLFLSAPTAISFLGYSSTDVLSYYWL